MRMLVTKCKLVTKELYPRSLYPEVSILIVADVGPVIASVVVVAWRDAPWRRRDVARRDATWRDVCNVHGVARHLSYCYY